MKGQAPWHYTNTKEPKEDHLEYSKGMKDF